ncbi:hypothetical protein ANO14919_070030 [Xylariales sp. No.14919]|nr:hypothetical protein ANO14919_070030 [Xylariales sp. No.14919]
MPTETTNPTESPSTSCEPSEPSFPREMIWGFALQRKFAIFFNLTSSGEDCVNTFDGTSLAHACAEALRVMRGATSTLVDMRDL